ncbi:MAG: DUF4249 family protein [Crocinitomicaceae bacterium]|nr:DUF4249 family protein [Crocinitomicaceae bacterium]
MKKISLYITFLALAVTTVFQSCETEIQLTGEFEPIPIIYGILDQDDSIHYIKINRTFTGNNNPSASAMVPDSSYWNTVDAYVYEIDQISFVNADTLRVWQLRDTLIQNKDTNGVFFGPEQKVYYFLAGPNGSSRLKDSPDIKYVLKASMNSGEYYAESTTELVRTDYSGASDNVRITNPTSTQDWNFATFPGGNIDYKTEVLQFYIGNADLFNVKMVILYDEYQGASVESKELKWSLGEYATEGQTGTYSLTILGEEFYKFIGENVADDPAVTKRQFTGLRIDIVAGSAELYKYIQITAPSTSLSQAQPTYSNIAGAYGLWASRTSISQYKPAYNPASASLRALTKSSLEALCVGSAYTSSLKFCSGHPADNTEIWYCP